MNRLFARIPWAEVIFFVLAWVGMQWAFQSRAFNDPGALWHVKVGERILADGFMRTDPFTYTFTGQTWIPQQWGGEVLMALAHLAGGLDAMLLGFSAGVAGLFTWVFSRMVRNGMHPLLAALVAGLAGVVAAFHFYARPHMATIAGMAVTMAAIVDFERGRCDAWRLWWLIPINVIWLNIHGGVLGGVMTLGMAVAGWGSIWVGRWVVGEVAKRKSAIHDPTTPPNLHPTTHHLHTPIVSWRVAFLLVGIVVACGLTPFVNPFGMEMLNTWKKIVGSTAMKQWVEEHKPLSLASTAGQVTVGFAVFYAFLLAGTLPKWPRVSWLLPLVWLVLSVQSIRQGPLFVVVAAVAIADLWPHTVWYRLLKKYGDSLARDPQDAGRSWGWVAVSGVVIAVVFALQLAGVHAPVVGRGWAKIDPLTNPVELRDDLAAFPGTRLFNDANLGGFVVYHAPHVQIFMDDRFELYGDQWLRDYVDVVFKNPDKIEVWADTYQFDHALVQVNPEKATALEKYLSESPRWVLISSPECKTGKLFRRLPPPQSP